MAVTRASQESRFPTPPARGAVRRAVYHLRTPTRIASFRHRARHVSLNGEFRRTSAAAEDV